MNGHRIFHHAAIVWFAFALLFSALAFADGPPVKKSRNGICHAAGSTYYSRTTHHTPYPTMAACLKSGGRRPKR